MLDVSLLLKIAGISILIMFITKILESSGKNDYAMTINLAGIVAILIIVVYQINKALGVVKSLFQL